jgi:hypothetical protein
MAREDKKITQSETTIPSRKTEDWSIISLTPSPEQTKQKQKQKQKQGRRSKKTTKNEDTDSERRKKKERRNRILFCSHSSIYLHKCPPIDVFSFFLGLRFRV